LKVNEDVKRALKDPATSIKDKCFEIGIEYKGSGLVRTTRYMVQHIIKSDSIDGDLLKWAANEKLIPWVAVAAQLSVSFPQTPRLYSVLNSHARQTLHTASGDRFSQSYHYPFSIVSLFISMGSSVYRLTVLDCIS